MYVCECMYVFMYVCVLYKVMHFSKACVFYFVSLYTCEGCSAKWPGHLLLAKL